MDSVAVLPLVAWVIWVPWVVIAKLAILIHTVANMDFQSFAQFDVVRVCTWIHVTIHASLL